MKLLILKVLNTSNDKNNLFTWFAHHFLFGLGCFLESLFPLQKACQTNICITSSAVIWRRNSNWQKTAHVELSSYSSKIPTNPKNKKWDQEFKHSTFLNEIFGYIPLALFWYEKIHTWKQSYIKKYFWAWRQTKNL